MPKVYIQWRNHRDDLARLVAEGKSLAEIGALYGADRSAVGQACVRLGIKYDPEVAERLRRAALIEANKDPQVRRNKSVAAKRACARPEVKARRSEGLKRMYAADPSHSARLSKRMTAYMAAKTPEERSAHVRRARLAMRAWCPPEKWDDYIKLRDKLHSAAEAKRIILEEVQREAAAKAKADAAFARTFEGKLARAKAGAPIVNRADLWKHHGNDNIASYGVASGLLA